MTKQSRVIRRIKKMKMQNQVIRKRLKKMIGHMTVQKVRMLLIAKLKQLSLFIIKGIAMLRIKQLIETQAIIKK